MAFQAPTAGQGRANRKILEELEEKKKQLRLQAQAPSQLAAPVAPTTSLALTPGPSTQAGGPESYHMTPSQRAALQHAHANSVGYFITQDSSFGNLILPVLPRLEKPV